MSIKKELQAYYAKQGLTGKHLRKALQWDMKAVKRNRKNHSNCISGAFCWMDSPQGHYYWSRRNEATGL